MVVRAGYGIYYNTSFYQPLALQMAQQEPLSKSLSVANTTTITAAGTVENSLSLANGFLPSLAAAFDTFAIDPNLRAGYSHNWNLSVQRDLPGSLVATLTYLGIKGTRGLQMFLPNTYPLGAETPAIVPGRVSLCDLERQFHARERAGAVAAPFAQRAVGERSIHFRQGH